MYYCATLDLGETETIEMYVIMLENPIIINTRGQMTNCPPYNAPFLRAKGEL